MTVKFQATKHNLNFYMFLGSALRTNSPTALSLKFAFGLVDVTKTSQAEHQTMGTKRDSSDIERDVVAVADVFGFTEKRP